LPIAYQRKLMYLIDMSQRKQPIKKIRYTFFPDVCEATMNAKQKKQNS